MKNAAKWFIKLGDVNNHTITWRTGVTRVEAIDSMRKADHVGPSVITVCDPSGKEMDRVAAPTFREALELLK